MSADVRTTRRSSSGRSDNIGRVSLHHRTNSWLAFYRSGTERLGCAAIRGVGINALHPLARSGNRDQEKKVAVRPT